MVFQGYWLPSATHFYPFLSFGLGDWGNHVTTSTFMMHRSLLPMSSHGACQQHPRQSNRRCCLRQIFEFWYCSH